MRGMTGFRGQSMNGQKSETRDSFPVKFLLNGPTISGDEISATFTAPESALYQFALWGAGGGDGSDGGGGGALAIKNVRLSIGASAAFVIGSTNPGHRDSTATFPDNSVMTAGGGADGVSSGGAGGAASGGDINVSGSAGTSGAGGQAASYGGYVGGLATIAPGGGGRAGGNTLAAGGSVMVTKMSSW